MRGRSAAFDLLGRWGLIGLIGIVPSCGWFVAMVAHAHFHYAFVYRHLILCFELWAIFLAVQAARPIERWLGRLNEGTTSPFHSPRAAAVLRHAVTARPPADILE